MSDAGIFVVGLLVTLVVGAALALLVWAAIQDGRIQREFDDERSVEDALRNAVASPVP